MRALIVGPGRIGCGYLAPTLADAGWEVVLAARDEEAAHLIRAVGSFAVRVTSPVEERRAVRGLEAVAVGTPAFERAVGEASLVCTAVGVGNVPALAEPLAHALARRPEDRLLDVWVVENGDCAGALAQAVRERAHAPLSHVGFAGGVATAVVSNGCWTDGRPEFVGDAPRQLYLDARGLVAGLPLPRGVVASPHYEARLQEKLFVFNAAHAICAYLGWLRGHETIDEAVTDRALRGMVVGCLLESRRALAAAHPELGSEVRAPTADALRRFGDRELADPVVRVARDPIRKLGPGDRLLGPVQLVREATGSVPSYFALAVAGALLYREPGDAQAEELGELLARNGVRAALERVCGLDADDRFARAVAARYRNFVITPTETHFPPVHAPGGSVGARV